MGAQVNGDRPEGRIEKSPLTCRGACGPGASSKCVLRGPTRSLGNFSANGQARADRCGQPSRGTHGSLRGLDRPGASASAAGRHHPGPGQPRARPMGSRRARLDHFVRLQPLRRPRAAGTARAANAASLRARARGWFADEGEAGRQRAALCAEAGRGKLRSRRRGSATASACPWHGSARQKCLMHRSACGQYTSRTWPHEAQFESLDDGTRISSRPRRSGLA